MSPDTNVNYEFGGFVLAPSNRQIFHYNQPVSLSGKDFDVLLYLVQNPNVLIRTDDLVDEVWGPERSIHAGNVSNHIAKVRKALGCDPHNPTFIQTVHASKGYRFIMPVEQIALETVNTNEGIKDNVPRVFTEPETFRLATHVFVPVYLGPHLFSGLEVTEKRTRWLRYKEFWTEGARLCILPSGVGVWHLVRDESFATLTDAAKRRQELYDRIFQNDLLGGPTSELLARFPSKEEPSFRQVLGKPGYAYSVMVMRSPQWKNLDKIRKVLEILACPKVLEPKDDSRSERDRLRALERQFLEHGFNSLDTRGFGLAGDDLGFATWEGVSYCHLSKGGEDEERFIIEFQIAVHALWWLSKCLSDVWLSDPDDATVMSSKCVPELKKLLMIVKNIEAKESTSQRMIEEAVLDVNRVEQVVSDTVELYS